MKEFLSSDKGARNPNERHIPFRRKIKHTFPGLYLVYSKLRLAVWKSRVRLKMPEEIRALIDPHREIYIDVERIQFACRWDDDIYRPGMYDKRRDRGAVLDGEWDRNVIPFESLDVYRAFHDRFIENREWRDTDFYHRLLGQILNGITKRRMRTNEDLDRRMDYLDRLYQRIKSEGYKPLRQIRGADAATDLGSEDEVSVRISRDGDLLFEDGRHRLSIAKVLGIQTIPARVTARHSEWFEFVREVWKYAGDNNGEIPSPITHPDLNNVPAAHGWDRWDIIRTSLPFSAGTALVIGCKWGFYCHRLEDIGFHCIGLEVSERDLHFAEKLKRAERRSFQLTKRPITAMGQTQQIDLILAVDGLHDLLQYGDLRSGLLELLERSKVQAMILGCDKHDRGNITDVEVGLSAYRLVDFVSKNSPLQKIRPIGADNRDKNFYLLTID